MRYSSGDVEQTFGDMQRRAWAMDTNGIRRCHRCHPYGPASPRRKGGGIKSLGLFWNVGPTEVSPSHGVLSKLICCSVQGTPTVTAPVGAIVLQMGHAREKALLGTLIAPGSNVLKAIYHRFSQICFHVPGPSAPFLEHLRETPC